MSNNSTNNGETHDASFWERTGQSRGNRVECAWLAGLIEGDGSIFLNKNHSRSDKYPYLLTPGIIVSMQCKTTVYRAREIVFNITHRKYDIKEHGKGSKTMRHVMYAFKVTDQKGVRKVCEAILPYLVGKREQAEIVIEFCSVRKGRRHTTGHPENLYGDHEKSLFERMNAARKSAYTTPLGVVETERRAPNTEEAVA